MIIVIQNLYKYLKKCIKKLKNNKIIKKKIKIIYIKIKRYLKKKKKLYVYIIHNNFFYKNIFILYIKKLISKCLVKI